MARAVREWVIVSLFTLLLAMFLGAAAIIGWSISLTRPTRGGITAGEYIGAWQPFRFVLYPGAAGVLALAITAVAWLIFSRRDAGADLTQSLVRTARYSFFLVPLGVAIVCAVALIVNADPEMWRRFPPRR